MTITVIGTAKTRGLRPLWVLEEIGLAYDQEAEFPRSDRAFELNPLGTVPILLDGDIKITDSIAMLYYLSDKTGQLTFPAGTQERADLDARINFLTTDLEAPLWVKAKHSFVLPEEDRVIEAKAPAQAEFHRAEARFATLLGDSEFLVGDRFTIADIVAGHLARWATNDGTGIENPIYAAYFERLKTRPSWQRANEK